MTTKRKRVAVCVDCGSSDVTHDAVVRWSPEQGDWVVSNVFDDAYCGECSHEVELEFVRTPRDSDPDGKHWNGARREWITDDKANAA